jgi:FtsH-binding integral membrane protein
MSRAIWRWLPLALIVLIAGLVLMIPISTDSSTGPQQERALVFEEPWVLLVLVIPVTCGVLASEGVRRGSRAFMIAAVLLFPVFIVLGLASIGLFFVPGWVATIAAATQIGKWTGAADGAAAVPLPSH